MRRALRSARKMDDARKLLLTTCLSLIKVQERLHALSRKPRKLRDGTWESMPAWPLSALDPSSPWLHDCPASTSVTGVIAAISLVMTHLLAMVESDGPIDAKAVCVALQHLSMEGYGSHWNEPANRFAKRAGITLPAAPGDWHNGLSLHHRSMNFDVTHTS
jgi:hypothetical protein